MSVGVYEEIIRKHIKPKIFKQKDEPKNRQRILLRPVDSHLQVNCYGRCMRVSDN